MNVRLAVSATLLVFMYPICSAILQMDAEQPLKWIAILAYAFNATYLAATGFNILNKGRPW